MYTKYYDVYIPSKKVSAERKRRQILRNRIKTACVVAGILAFIYMFGVVGSLEQDMITIKQAIIHGAISIGIMAASVEICERI